jgi:hypothetical protein
MGVIMERTRMILAMLVALAVTGCVTNYQYRTYGNVTATDGEMHQAVIYWHKDEGRLWYGKKYEQLDTDATMRICGGTFPKIFALADDGTVELLSKSGDFLIARINDTGNLEPVPEVLLQEGGRCGLILVKGKPAATNGLKTGVRPEVSILCKNATRPDRYPEVGKYQFDPVSRMETGEDRSGPDACLSR